MKLKNKLFGVGLSLSMMATSVMGVHAIETDVINEKWGKPTVVYGGGLSEYQVEQTRELFNITNTENVYEMYVDANDLATYLNFYGGSTSSLISSVMVQKTDDTGVVVNILTPDNITNITKEQYANAAITAGVYDCEIDVASISRVTGESALTGVYKAFEANGETLDLERTEIAQEELEITNGIANENAYTEGFNSELLSEAIIEIKQDLAELKDKNGDELSVEDIQQIVMNILQKYHLDELLTEENIQALINFAKKYANSNAIDSKEVLRQLKVLSQSFGGDVQNLIQQAQDSGFFDRVIQWLKQLLNL